MKIKRPALALALTLGLGLFDTAAAAPITFSTALPVDRGGIIYRQQVRVQTSETGRTQARPRQRNYSATSVLAYGAHERLALFAAIPYVERRRSERRHGTHVHRDSEGIGDITGLARYTLSQQDGPGYTWRQAVFVGATAPTGDHNEADRFGRQPPPLWEGSGAWQGHGGVVATYQTLDFQIDGQLAYRHHGTTDGFQRGDVLRLDLSWQQRVWPREIGAGVPAFWYGVVELNSRYQQRHRRDGRRLADAGGTTIWLSPGLQYVTKRWVWEAIIQKPIHQRRHGQALDNDWIANAGFRVRF